MDEIRASEQRMTRRILIISIVLAAIGALVFLAIVVNQNYALVSEKYARMRSLTRDILLNMQDAVVTVDRENRITIFSRQAEELFGATADAVMGRKPEDLPSRLAACLRAVFSGRESELRLECGAGNHRTVSVSLSSTTGQDGTPESRTAVIKDLTDARRLEAELQRKDKLTAMGALASGVAHEIRNPLNAISMIAQRYEREFSPRKGLRTYRSLTNVLKKESARVNDIIGQFLAYARPPKLNRSEVSIDQLVQHVATLFETQAKGKRVQFVAKSQVGNSILIDPDQITQALLNLLQNALDATPKDGTISLLADRTADELIITVLDNGRGIPRDEIGRIFDLYFTTKDGGTGMGLAITQQIVSQHGGRVEVTSEPGNGSSFVIRIPVP